MKDLFINAAAVAICTVTKTGTPPLPNREVVRETIAKLLHRNSCSPSIFLADDSGMVIGTTRLWMKDSVVYFERVVGQTLISGQANALGREIMLAYRLYRCTFLDAMVTVVGEFNNQMYSEFMKLFDELVQSEYARHFN